MSFSTPSAHTGIESILVYQWINDRQIKYLMAACRCRLDFYNAAASALAGRKKRLRWCRQILLIVQCSLVLGMPRLSTA
jgi:hypothetical protein